MHRFVKTLCYLNHSVTGVCKVANSILSSCWGGKSNVKEGRGRARGKGNFPFSCKKKEFGERYQVEKKMGEEIKLCETFYTPEVKYVYIFLK